MRSRAGATMPTRRESEPEMPPTDNDPTIYVGLHLYDGSNYDTVVQRVEHGGFGVIAFGPNQLDKNEMVAYKTLRCELLKDPLTRASFVRECLLWVGLWGHANVALAYAMLEMGDAIDQRPFLALAYADNGSLRTLLRNTARQQPGGRLRLDIALHLAQQIAAGLAYLHRPEPDYLRTVPTVHRDLKPENVLIMKDGRAVITDFGLAKAVEASPTALALLLSSQTGQAVAYGQQGQMVEEAIVLAGEEAIQTTSLQTADGIALGTVVYMAPEQWTDARRVGTPADIYALGIMLSEILAGRHALLDLERPQTRGAWRAAHENPQPRPLREVAPDVPEVVEMIYWRCLARNPSDRPSADEVLAALQAGARAAGLEPYTPVQFVQHTPFNEFVHWHQWGNAYAGFELYHKALECSERALTMARQLHGERPDLLPATLLTRGAVLSGLGAEALDRAQKARVAAKTHEAQRLDAEAAEWDRQADQTYQEALKVSRPVTTPEGREDRAAVWVQIGIHNTDRRRYAYGEDAYRRALEIRPDMANTYYNRALTQARWGMSEAQAGRRDPAIAHLRQARVFAVTSMGMNDPTAPGLLQDIEDALRQLGVSDHA